LSKVIAESLMPLDCSKEYEQEQLLRAATMREGRM